MADWIKKGLYEKAGYELYRKLPDYRTKWFDNSTGSPSQLSFLMGLIKEYRFTDGTKVNCVAEVGTCRGISALYMLKAGTMYNHQYHQYDIDIGNRDFYGEVVKTEATAAEMEHWTFANGKTTLDIESILSKDNQIDMIFIDGAHAHPYPLLDLIMLLPYMRKDALVCFHDVEFYNIPGEFGAAYIYTGWREEKYLSQCVENNSIEPCYDESLGLLKLPEDAQELYDNLVEIAGQEVVESFFNYSQEHQKYWGSGYVGMSPEGLALRLLPFMSRHYPADFVRRFWEAMSRELRLYREHWVSLQHINRLMCSYSQDIEVLQKRIDILEKRQFRRYVEEHVPEGAKVAVFGAGGVGHQVYAALSGSRHCQVIGWVDNGWKRLSFDVMAPDILREKDCDYVLVAVEKEKMRDEIFHQLADFGFAQDRTVWVPNLVNLNY